VENKEDLDQLFKNSLLEPDIPFNEEDWKKMSQKLDAQSRRRTMPVWLFATSAAAAILLVMLFWVFFMPASTVKKDNKGQIVLQLPKGAGKSSVNGGKPAINESKPASQEDLTVNSPATASAEKRNETTKRLQPGALTNMTQQPTYTRSENQLLPPTITPESQGNQLSPLSNPALIDGSANIPFDASIDTRLARSNRIPKNYKAVQKAVNKKMKANTGAKSGLVLSAMLGPDLSYAKSSISSKVSSNAGLLATYGLSPKLSITSGAIYSNKYYNSNIIGVNAYNLSGDPYQVNASCNVIDIPVNVNYKVLDKKAFSISVNTGLSSYLMLKEKYAYIYPQPGANPIVTNLEVSNQNKHIFGVANVAVSFERKINSNLSIGVQPFMKLPLTGIGAGDASLKSSGLSFTVNMGLFPVKKPGRVAALRRY
jgi:hypothetical protein